MNITGRITQKQSITGTIKNLSHLHGIISKPPNQNQRQNIERTVTLAVTGTALKMRSCTVRQLEFET